MDEFINICLNAGLKASSKILDIYQEDFKVRKKEDNSFVTRADIESSAIIAKELNPIGFPIICEEREIPEYSERVRFQDFFLIDPLDGTKEFVNRTGEFCINIAWIQNAVPTLGFIFDPLNNLVVYGGKQTNEVVILEMDVDSQKFGKKRELSNSTLANNQIIRLITSGRADIKQLNSYTSEFYESKKIEIIKKGSALKFIDLALDKADIYPRFGNTMEWDIAPGFAILEQLEGSITDLKGKSKLSFNKPNLLNPPFIAYNKKNHE